MGTQIDMHTQTQKVLFYGNEFSKNGPYLEGGGQLTDTQYRWRSSQVHTCPQMFPPVCEEATHTLLN